MATRTFGTTAGNWATAALWSGGVAPTAADDVVFSATSANCTIAAAAVCRGIDASAYPAGKTLTHNAFTLTIGDGTAGAGNKALDFSGGFTYTLANATTSAISFQSSSATQQTINFNGKTSGQLTFGATAVSGNYLFSTDHTAVAIITLTRGVLDITGRTCTWGGLASNNSNTRTLTITNATINISNSFTSVWDMSTITGLTFNSSGSTINIAKVSPTFSPSNRTFNNVNFTGGGQTLINGSSNGTYANLSITGTAAKTDTLSLSGNTTITGTFTVMGNSAINRVLVFSSVVGTPRTITAAAISVDNTDFQDITGAGNATWDMSANSVGNCGGNTMKALGDSAFPVSETQTATGTASFNWSTHGWTTRVPLPQDDVVINNSFSASQTITMDMPRMGKSITFAGATGTPEWNGTLNASMYGSLTLISGMTFTGSSFIIAFCGRGNYNITTATKSFPSSINIIAPTGTYNQMDDMTFSASGNHTVNNGTYNSNGYAITCNLFNGNSTTTRTYNLTGSTITSTNILATNALGSIGFVSTGLTYIFTGSTFVISNTGVRQKVFVGGGLTYNNLTITGRNVLITGSNTFNVLSDNTAGLAEGLYLTAGTTQTVNSFLTNGSAGSLARLRSSTSGLYGGGITLNGTNMAYSTVDHADFRPAGNFSVMAVFKTTATGVLQNMFQSYSETTTVAGFFLMMRTDNKIRFESGKNTGLVSATDYNFVTSTNALNDGAWHRVVGVYDGAKLHIYVDGTENGTGTVWTNAAAFAATNYIRLGCWRQTSSSDNSWFNGRLDEVALWNGTALTAANVTTLQSSQLADSAALLASSTRYYPFNKDRETYDEKNNVNDLTAIGTPTLTTPGKLAKPTKHNTIDYTDIADTIFQGGTKWYASTHSVDSAGNTGMNFIDAVPDGKGWFRM